MDNIERRISNEKLFNANVKLMDENKFLKQDIQTLQGKIQKVNEYISLFKDNEVLAKVDKLLNGDSVDD